jgi:hypothetical protein
VPRVRVYEDSTRDDRESSCNMSSKKLPKKETICETSTSTTSTVTDLPTPFVTMSDDHIKSLKQISTTLQSTLETTNRVYRAAMDEFPNMETMFALMRNGVQGHSMEITVYQPRILVEYCDFMTSISTVSQGFLFCCIFKISQPVS